MCGLHITRKEEGDPRGENGAVAARESRQEAPRSGWDVYRKHGEREQPACSEAGLLINRKELWVSGQHANPNPGK